MDPETGEVKERIRDLGRRFVGLALGDGHLWPVNEKDKEIYQIHPLNGKVVSRISCPFRPRGIAWHDGSLWLTQGRGKIHELNQGKFQSPYCSPPCMAERIEWYNSALWAFDRRSSALVVFETCSRLG